MNPVELVEVYSTDNLNEAEVLQMALQGEGFRCEIDGKTQAGLTGLTVFEIKLLVKAEDYDKARAYLEEHKHRES